MWLIDMSSYFSLVMSLSMVLVFVSNLKLSLVIK